MVEFIIPSSSIHHNASNKQLTFDPPYNLLKVPNITLIYDLTISSEIYNSENPRKRKAPKQIPGVDISIDANGVLTYTADETTLDTDEIKICVNTDQYSLSTTEDLFTNETVAASTTVTTTTPLRTGKLSKLLVYVSNSGASTDCDVTIYASPTSSTTGRKKILAPFNVGDGSVNVYETGNGIDPQQLDDYIWGEIINNDALNPAIITVTLSEFR